MPGCTTQTQAGPRMGPAVPSHSPVTVRPTPSREGPFTVHVAADSPYTMKAAGT
ncbi:uncharacterized protein BDZ83DRAFT_139391 [Colletotrichum acutatum]|uniref:Uncharacterized protein n=1 Tax=Glomerella acutata TaxID=27357 RepID=A0AAD8UXJ3_GLOAC|nr:uncharacterized protein BDZ83DRAFT_139391 [Colletotrichum acutatum]KAK1728305.1 hypothetical protein BDZ83DRAFT_139391 [Colletotrichum acutatum]